MAAFGTCEMISITPSIDSTIGFRSLLEKNGWKGILSVLFSIPMGFEEPLEWRVMRWMIVRAAMISGSKKCSEKNRVRVGCLTEKPPHIHSTIVFPKYGMAEKMLVITVAPQNDI